MGFKTANEVWNVVDSIRQGGVYRSRNRARINAVFNGEQPYSDKEARENHIETNVNFLEGTRIIHQSRQQFTTGFMQPANYFTMTYDSGPVFKRDGWARTVTKHLNRTLKRSSKYRSVLDNQFASAVLHGPGPATWLRRKDWCPHFRGVDDMMIPTNTLQSLENLAYFGVRISFTAAELCKLLTADKVDAGWNKPLIKSVVPQLVKRQVTANNAETTYDWTNFERMVEDYKEQSAYWGSDAVPVVWCYDFYFLDTNVDEKPQWRRRIVLDRNCSGYQDIGEANKEDWLYDGKNKEYGASIEQLMHTQFADGAVVPPFRWHSVRSLGYLLYAVCNLQNQMRCKWSDAAFEHMLWYFRNVSEGDHERLGSVTLKHLGIIPQGLDFVPGTERHTINPALLKDYMSSNRQLMAESAASYVQDVEQKGGTPPSATQIIAQVNSSNALIGSMMTRAYTQQIPGYREVARRFFTFEDNEDCRKFRENCLKDGVPSSAFENFDAWNVEPDRVMGDGNNMLAIAQSDRLMAIRPILNPRSQEEVTRMYVEATTKDPSVADRLVPREVPEPSLAVEKATLSWATLMTGKPVIISSPVNRIEYAQTLLQMLNLELSQIANSGQLPQPETVIGMSNVADTVEAIVVKLKEDEGNEQIVSQMVDALKRSAEIITGYAEEIAKARQEGAAQPQLDPETQAKIQAILLQAQTKAKIAETNAESKRQQKEMAFVQDQARKDAALASEMATSDIRTKADIARENLQAANEPAPTVPSR